jgi:hypothetical protein
MGFGLLEPDVDLEADAREAVDFRTPVGRGDGNGLFGFVEAVDCGRSGEKRNLAAREAPNVAAGAACMSESGSAMAEGVDAGLDLDERVLAMVMFVQRSREKGGR